MRSFRSVSSERDRGLLSRFRTSEAGVTIIELLIALTIFAVVASGVAVGMGSALGLTRNNRNRSVAANLAAREMDVVRSTQFDALPLTLVEKQETVDNVIYDITRTTDWVSKDGTSGVCSPPEGTALAFLKVTVTVTWPDMQGARPVESETILAPPVGAYDSDSGHLAVRVRDRNAAPKSGIVVTAVGPGGTTQLTTDAEGCAFFVGLTPGQFDVSLSTANHVDGQNNPTPEKPISVSAGAVTSAEFDYDGESTLSITLVGLTNYGVPNGLGATVANTGLSLGTLPFGGPGGSCTAPPTTLLSSGDASLWQQYPDLASGTGQYAAYAAIAAETGQAVRFLVKFDLPAAPVGCTLETATLRVYNSSPSSSARTLQAYQAGASWSESSVTWNNQPGTTGSAVTTSSPPSAGWMSWGVTSLVQSQYAGSNDGFVLRDSNEVSSTSYYNWVDPREGANDPELALTWTGGVSSCGGTQILNASADTYVRQDSSGTNFGTWSTMYVKARSSEARRVLIKFDLPAPSSCVLTAATLELFQESGDSGRTIRVYRASSSWSENSVTWNSNIGFTGTPSSAPSSGSTNVWRTWDVLGLVQSIYSGTNNGFLIRDSSEGPSSTYDQRYRTRENSSTSTRPKLTLTFQENIVLPTSQTITATPLFPYQSGYQVWGGTCLDADPEGIEPVGGLPYYAGGQRDPAVAANPNQTTSPTVSLKSADVRVRLSDDSNVVGASLIAYHDPDNGCPQGETYALGSTGSDGYVRIALPYGTWRFEVSGKTPVGSWPTVQLSPLTANPEAVTVTVNP